MSGPTAAAGSFFRILNKNIVSGQRVTKGPCWVINRMMCSKTQGHGAKPQASDSTFRVPGYQPTNWDKKMLVWTGRFKKVEDIPETVAFETVDAARNKMRVKLSYVMIAMTIFGCIIMIIAGKQAAKRHETLASQNLERKAQWREEAARSSSAKP